MKAVLEFNLPEDGDDFRDSFNWEGDAPWESKADLKHNEQEFERYYINTYKGGEQ